MNMVGHNYIIHYIYIGIPLLYLLKLFFHNLAAMLSLNRISGRSKPLPYRGTLILRNFIGFFPDNFR